MAQPINTLSRLFRSPFEVIESSMLTVTLNNPQNKLSGKMLMMNLLCRITSPSPSGKNVLPAFQVQVLKWTGVQVQTLNGLL